MMRYLISVLLVVSVLTGCQSTARNNYYVLTAPVIQPDAVSSSIETVIGVGPVEVAEYLNRRQIAYQSESGELIMPGNDYWAESLEKGIGRVLALNLTAADTTRSVVAFPWRSDSKPRYSVRINLQSLDRVGQQARIDAVWELIDNDEKKSLLRKRFIQTAPAGAGSQALTQAYSTLLAALARDIDLGMASST